MVFAAGEIRTKGFFSQVISFDALTDVEESEEEKDDRAAGQGRDSSMAEDTYENAGLRYHDDEMGLKDVT